VSDVATPSPRQDGRPIGRQLLIGALCFGPPLVFFIWISIRYFDWSVLLIPIIAAISAIFVNSRAKRHDRDIVKSLSSSGTRAPATPNAISRPAAKSARGSWISDALLSGSFLAVALLVFSHIQGHSPEEHGTLPIEVQAILAIGALSGLGWLTFRRLLARLRDRRDGLN
jgi:hypothetical protein